MRHPLDHVRSLADGFNGEGALVEPKSIQWDVASWAFSSRFCPRVRAAWAFVRRRNATAARLRLAAVYYLDWNALAAKNARARVQIEALDAAALLEALGLPVVNATARPTPRGGHGAHERRLDWPDLDVAVGAALSRELKARAAAYGYPVPEL